MKKIIAFILPALFCHNLFSQNELYDIKSIPEALKKDAHVIKRFEKIEFEIKSISKAAYKVQQVITIMDPSAKDELVFYQFTDKFHSLEDVEIKVYDDFGKVINKYKKKDLSVQSSGSGLVPDGKVNYYQVAETKYPITIGFEYTIVHHGMFSYPGYYIQETDEAVEKSTFIVKVPKHIDIRFKPMNTAFTPVVDESDKENKSYSWNINLLPAKKYEDGSGDVKNGYPWILIAPNKFELDGYPGEMNSWKNMGIWYNTLVKADNTLDANYAAEIKNITAAATSDLEKLKIIYTYLQNNFRYVSIQLGIGGLKPFSANFVHKNKYGDCKALSNYMQACLNAVNIKSYSAWIKGDAYPNTVDASFPFDPFNHQILCAPLASDTVWLECTSNTAEFGVLGSFTENRPALLLTENGGVLINTPRSKAENNFFSSKVMVDLSADGSGNATAALYTSGEYKDDIKHYFFDQKKDDQKKFLINNYGFLQPDDLEINYDKTSKHEPVKLRMAFEKIPEFTAGNKQFLNPRIYKIWSYAMPKAENRTQDFYFSHPFIKTDTTIYKLPEGFSVETLPKTKEIKFEYGSFKSTYVFDETKKTITSTARLELTEFKIPVAKFVAAKRFFNDVLGEYTEKIVIKKL